MWNSLCGLSALCQGCQVNHYDGSQARGPFRQQQQQQQKGHNFRGNWTWQFWHSILQALIQFWEAVVKCQDSGIMSLQRPKERNADNVTFDSGKQWLVKPSRWRCKVEKKRKRFFFVVILCWLLSNWNESVRSVTSSSSYSREWKVMKNDNKDWRIQEKGEGRKKSWNKKKNQSFALDFFDQCVRIRMRCFRQLRMLFHFIGPFAPLSGLLFI